MKRSYWIFLMLLGYLCTYAQQGEQILKKMDLNRKYSTIEYSASMAIYVGNEIRVKQMRTRGVSKGEQKAVVEFVNVEDQGTKYLMIGENLWIYFPDEKDVVKISGHMLKEGMMGSDVSYQDALESDELTNKYQVTLLGDEKINDMECYVLQLDGKVKDVPYQKRKMWVDKENYVALKEEMFAKSGKLLKESNVLQIKKISGKSIPVKVEMINKLRKNSKTVFEMTDITFDIEMDENEFTMRYLQR